MPPILPWDLPAEPVKNTFPPDLTIFKTSVCSGDNETPGSSVTGVGSLARLDGSLLGAGAESPEVVGIGLLSTSGGRIGARGSVDHLTRK